VLCAAVIKCLSAALKGISLCSNSLAGQPFSQCDSELFLVQYDQVPEVLTRIVAPTQQKANRCRYPEAIVLRSNADDGQSPAQSKLWLKLRRKIIVKSSREGSNGSIR